MPPDAGIAAAADGPDVPARGDERAPDVLGEAAAVLSRRAREQTGDVADALRGLGAQVTALADGRRHEAGEVEVYARLAADGITRVAERVEELGFDGIVEELGRFAGRRPATFLACAAAAGFVAGRLLRHAETEPVPYPEVALAAAPSCPGPAPSEVEPGAAVALPARADGKQPLAEERAPAPAGWPS